MKSGGADQDDTELRTFAMIVYEFTVAGRKYQGSRVSIGEDLGNFEVAETLAKYPKGKAVTVFYNPRKPAEAVLERDLPTGIWKGLIIIVLVLVGLIFGGWFGFSKLGDFMATVVRNPSEAPFVTACIGFALLAALVIFGIQRNAARQRSWPTVKGKVQRSGVHEFQELQRRDSGPDVSRTAYRAEVIYGYDIAGVHYTGDTAASGTRVSSNLEAVARKSAEKYPVGTDGRCPLQPGQPRRVGDQAGRAGAPAALADPGRDADAGLFCRTLTPRFQLSFGRRCTRLECDHVRPENFAGLACPRAPSSRPRRRRTGPTVP